MVLNAEMSGNIAALTQANGQEDRDKRLYFRYYETVEQTIPNYVGCLAMVVVPSRRSLVE